MIEAMETSMVIYHTLTRLAIVPQMICVLVVIISLFSWTMGEFGPYHIACLVYLFLESTHDMILKFRNASYDNLVQSAMAPTWLVPGAIISTDKKFNPYHAGCCLILGLAKMVVAFFQIGWVKPEYLPLVIFYTILVANVLIVISEIIMFVYIGLGKQSEFMSIQMRVNFNNATQPSNPCRYRFRVVGNSI